MIFETHAHYDDEQFDADRDELLCDLPKQGISPVINVGASIASTRKTLELAGKYPYVYAAVGIHPEDAKDLNDGTYGWLEELAQQEKVVAIGEIGLDYHWEKEPDARAYQRLWFVRQLALAQEAGLPVIIHSRDAAEDTMRIMEAAQDDGITGVIHCYSYSAEMAQQYVEMGYYIGVGGVVTFPNAKKLVETVETVPLSHILLETDCPYMAPVPHRGERNDSRYIPHVIDRIAEIKGVSPEEVEKTTRENAFRLFTKVKKDEA